MKNENRAENPTSPRAPLAISRGDQLTADQLAAIKEFIEQLGGIENARRAVAALQDLKHAA